MAAWDSRAWAASHLNPHGLGAGGFERLGHLLRVPAMEVDRHLDRTLELAALLRLRRGLHVGPGRMFAGGIVGAGRLYEHIASRNAAFLHRVLDRELRGPAGVEFGDESAFHDGSFRHAAADNPFRAATVPIAGALLRDAPDNDRDKHWFASSGIWQKRNRPRMTKRAARRGHGPPD